HQMSDTKKGKSLTAYQQAQMRLQNLANSPSKEEQPMPLASKKFAQLQPSAASQKPVSAPSTKMATMKPKASAWKNDESDSEKPEKTKKLPVAAQEVIHCNNCGDEFLDEIAFAFHTHKDC